MHISDLTTKWLHSHQCFYNCQSQVWWLHLLLQGTFCHLSSSSIILFYLIKVLKNEKKIKAFVIRRWQNDSQELKLFAQFSGNYQQVLVNKKMNWLIVIAIVDWSLVCFSFPTHFNTKSFKNYGSRNKIYIADKNPIVNAKTVFRASQPLAALVFA